MARIARSQEAPSFRRRELAIGGAALTSGLLGAACGPLRQEPPLADKSKPIVTLEMMGLQIPQHKDGYGAIIKLWEATDPRERIAYIDLPPGAGSYYEKLTALVLAGTPPPLVSHQGNQIAFAAAKKFLLPLDTIFKTAKIDTKKHFYESAYAPWEFKAKPYGVPTQDNGAGFGMVIRTDIFQSAGVPVPNQPFATFDEAYDVARRLTRREGDRFVRIGWTYHMLWLMTYVFGAMLEAGQPYFDDKTRKYQVNTPAGVDAIQKIMVDPIRLGIDDPTLKPYPEYVNLLKGPEGKLAMALQNSGMQRSATQEKLDTAPFLKFLVKPGFKGNRRYFVGESGWGVAAYAGSKYPDRVGGFLAHVASPAGQRAWTYATNCAPSATQFGRDAPECKTAEFSEQQTVLQLQKFDETWRYFGRNAGVPEWAYAAVRTAAEKIRKSEIGARQAALEIDQYCQQKLADFDKLMAESGVFPPY